MLFEDSIGRPIWLASGEGTGAVLEYKTRINKRMKTHAEFRSRKFPPYEGEQEQINPGLWGKRLAEYLKEKLDGLGIETKGIIIEDWGCLLPVKNESFDLSVACGHQYGDDDVFLCFIEPSRPVIQKLFRKIDTTQEINRLSEALEKILASDPDIQDLRWLENPGG